MSIARGDHGLIKFRNEMFAFGGHDRDQGKRKHKSVEAFNMIKNSWRDLPDMPQVSVRNTVTRI